jgi:hypothetical protein
VIEGNDALLLTAGEDPGDRAPAPGSLRLIQALVNTLNAETGRDLLGTAPEAARWLTAAGLLPPQSALTGVQRAALVELREATRQVLTGHVERQEDPEAASPQPPDPGGGSSRRRATGERGPRPLQPGHRRRRRGHRRGGHGRHLGPPEVLPRPAVRMGVLRPVLVQPVAVVLYADLRRTRQDARLPGPAS